MPRAPSEPRNSRSGFGPAPEIGSRRVLAEIGADWVGYLEAEMLLQGGDVPIGQKAAGDLDQIALHAWIERQRNPGTALPRGTAAPRTAIAREASRGRCIGLRA